MTHLLHAALDAVHRRDYPACRELMSGHTPEEIRSWRTTLLAAAAQCDVVLYEPVPPFVQGFSIGTRT